MVGTYRDTDLDRTHPLSDALGDLNREQLASSVSRCAGCPRLRSATTSAAPPGQPSSPQLDRRIHEETEGNPFFLSEVLNLMTEEGTLTADSVSDVAMPDGVKEALGRRLDRLSPETNELLLAGRGSEPRLRARSAGRHVERFKMRRCCGWRKRR